MIASSFGIADDSNYTIAVGEDDRQRLIILNEIYNHFSLQFFRDCNVQEGSRILELGCGIGLMSQIFAQEVGKDGYILATDISEEQLQVARSLLPKEKLLNLEFKQLSAFDIGGLTEQFDIVCARFLLVHLKEPQKLIQKIKKVLKPGGKLIIEDITGNHTLSSSPHVEGMAVLHRLDQLQNEIQQSDDQYFASLPQMLEKEGFEVFSVQRAHPQLDTPRKRTSILFHLSSLKSSLKESLLTEEDFNSMLQAVQGLEKDASIKIHYYELGQICAIL